MRNLTVIIPSYNNLEYLKLCYKALRIAAPTLSVIMYDDGSNDGTLEWLNSLKDDNLTVDHSEKRIGHTYLYDYGIRMAKTEYVGILHSDMVVSEDFFNTLIPLLSEEYIVSGRCVEPPLHGEGAEKIVKDFGMVPEQFRYDDFMEFAKSNVNATTFIPSLFAPWFIHRQAYLDKVGMHDELFAPYGWEDSDLFIRMMKAGFEPRQYQNLLVYHFTQRGHRWNHGEVGKANDDYELRMHISKMRFLNKWGTLHWKDENHTPLKLPLYNKVLKIKNYDLKEPRLKYEVVNAFFNTVATDELSLIKSDYLLNKYPINYEVIIDYSINYSVADLWNFMMYLPLVIEEYDEGEYEQSGITIVIHNKEQLPTRL